MPTSNVSAQTPAPAVGSQDDPIALAIEKAVNRAVLAEAKVELYEEKLKAKDERIEALQMQIAVLKEQKGDLQGANQERREARTIDLERIADRDILIAKQDAEIQRLRHPGFFASLFDKRTIYGGIAGFGACKLTNGGTSIPGVQFTK